ncbi:MAG TPA: TOMM precursor leader peptide-binding protein [Kofleriaceae bacterium]
MHAKIYLAIVDDYLRPSLFELNRACLARGVPLFLVKPVGVRAWIGPLVVAGQTACWRCLEYRLRANREVEAYIERRTGKRMPLALPRARVPLFERHASSVAITQLVRFLTTGANPGLGSHVLVTDLTSLTFERHPIVRRPQCPDCGNPRLGTRAGLPVQLTAQRVAGESTSGMRRDEPEAVLQRYQHHVSPLTGIVREMTPSAWHGAGPLRVYMAGHNFALKNDHLFLLKDGLRNNSSGKGRTEAQARTSALCEALERYSGVFRGDEPRRPAPFSWTPPIPLPS